MTRCSSSVWRRLSSVGWKEHNTLFHVPLRVSRRHRLLFVLLQNTGANINDNMQRSGLAYFSNEANIPGDNDTFTLDAALPTEAPLQWFRLKELSYRVMSLRMDARIPWAVEHRLHPPLQSKSTGTRGGLDRQSDEVHSRFEILACDGGGVGAIKWSTWDFCLNRNKEVKHLQGQDQLGLIFVSQITEADICRQEKKEEKKHSQKWRRTWLA